MGERIVTLSLEAAGLRRNGSGWRVKPTSLEIRQGMIVGLVGRNGSGKSSLMSMLSGDNRPDEGKVFINGSPMDAVTARELARQRAVLSQEMTVSFPFTVREVVSWGRVPWRNMPQEKDDEAIVSEALESQGLLPIANRRITALSGGEKKRMHIARILAQCAPILLLDEADSDLDISGRQHLDEIVCNHKGNGGTAVIVSHDVARVSRICDEVILMNDGVITHHGTVNEVLTTANLVDTFSVDLTVVRDSEGVRVPIVIHVPDIQR